MNPEDPFDARELRDVIDLETKLAPRSAGFASQLGNRKPNLDFFRALADGENVTAMKPFMRDASAIDLLVGFTVAINADKMPFADAVEQAFTLHEDGGTWGVVAAILRSDPKLLLADLDGIFDATGVAADGSGSGADFSEFAAAQAQDGGGTAPPNPSDPDPREPPGGGGNPPGGGEDPPPEESDEPEDCSSTPECAANDIRDEIFPSPAPTDFVP